MQQSKTGNFMLYSILMLMTLMLLIVIGILSVQLIMQPSSDELENQVADLKREINHSEMTVKNRISNLENELDDLQNTNNRLVREVSDLKQKNDPNLISNVIVPMIESISEKLEDAEEARIKAAVDKRIENLDWSKVEAVNEKKFFDASKLIPVWKEEVQKVFQGDPMEAFEFESDAYQDKAVLKVTIDAKQVDVSDVDKLFESFKQFGWVENNTSVWLRAGREHGGLHVARYDDEITIIFSSYELLRQGRTGPWFTSEDMRVNELLSLFFYDVDFPLADNKQLKFDNGRVEVVPIDG